MTLRYGSVCSGIEAATAAWHHMGWEAAFFSEIEKFPCAVLEHRYPDVPLHGDFTTIKENEYGKIDLLVGGTPCQSFSVAGLRGGLDDDRGNLALEFCRLAQREQPRWIVWENVPGVLSSSGGRDFGSILGALEDLGYGLAYRVLDAQYFGVAQRRRRVFVVGYLGDWRPAAAVLFERHSMSGHSAPSRQARQEATDTAATGAGGSGGDGGARSDLDTFECGGIGSYSASDNSSPLLRTGADLGPGCEALIASTFNDDDTARTLLASGYDSSPCVDRGPDVVGTLRAHHPGTAGIQGDTDHIVATYPINSMNAFRSPDAAASTGLGVGHDGEAMYTLTKGDHHAIAFSSNMSVPDCQTDGSTPTLKLGGHGGGNPPAVAYSIMPMNSGKDYKARETDISQPLMAGGPVGGNQGGDFIVTPFDTTQLTSPYNYSNPQPGDPCHPLAAGAHPPAVAFPINTQLGLRGPDVSNTSRDGFGVGDEADPAYTLQATNPKQIVAHTATHEVAGTLMSHAKSGGWSNSIDHAAAGYMALVPAHTEPVIYQDSEFGVQSYDQAGTLRAGRIPAHQMTLQNSTQAVDVYNGSITGEVCATMGTSGSPINSAGPQVMQQSTVRRLTPVECERLQGFPDNFTAIPWRKKGAEDCPDGPRYKALGNSMAVPVMRWIGERINLIDDYLSII